MKISYVTDYNAADIRNWSGLGFYIAKTLSNQGNEIDYIGDLSHRAEMLYKAKKLLYRAVGKNYLWNREPAILKSLSRQATRKVREDSDIIFSPGTLPVAFMNPCDWLMKRIRDDRLRGSYRPEQPASIRLAGAYRRFALQRYGFDQYSAWANPHPLDAVKHSWACLSIRATYAANGG